jgi:hypothetical protein
MDYLTEETIHLLRTGQTPQTNIDPEKQNFKHIEALTTDDFTDIMSHCEAVHFEMLTTKSEKVKDRDYYDLYYHEVDEIFRTVGIKFAGHAGQFFGDFDALTQKFPDREQYIVTACCMYINMYRLLEIFKVSRESRSSMVWASDNDKLLCGIYAKYCAATVGREKTGNENIRRILGSNLAQEIHSLDIVNLATVPVHEIVNFRKNNIDLLTNFLLTYRDFLVDIQASPSESTEITKGHAKDIVKKFKEINKEILIHRKEREFGWLKRLSEPIFNSAQKGDIASIFSKLIDPFALIGMLGIGLLNLRSDSINEEKMLLSNDSGYLWKAHENWPKI